jgi:hypothetical protein
MLGQRVRGAMLMATVLSLGASPAEACNCFNRWFGAPATTTYYAPYQVRYAPAAPCGCAPPAQVVNYMPQTSFRTVYVNMPVVAYQPVTTANPCTGCATTVMRPVTSYVTQARVVPYTTYRPVVTAAYAPVVPACGGCATPVTAAYAPAMPMAAPAPAPCCTAGYAAAAPVASTTVMRAVVQQPTYASPAPAMAPNSGSATTPPTMVPLSPPPTSPSVTPPTGGPQMTPIPLNSPNRTFDEPSSNPGEPQSRLLRPQSSDSAPAATPRSLDPEDQDQTTYLPRLRAFAARPVSAPIAPPASPDDNAWRSARR